MEEERNEETVSEGGADMEEEKTGSAEGSGWLKWIIAGLVILIVAAGAGWWGWGEYVEYRQQRAEEYIQKAEEIQAPRDGYQSGEAALEKLKLARKALEYDPTRTDFRTRVIHDLYPSTSSLETISKKDLIELLREGLETELPDEDRIKLIKYVAKYGWGKQIFGSNKNVLWRAVELAPYTDWAVKRRLIYAKYRAKEGAEDALEFLDKAREVVKKHAEMKDYNPEKKLLYLDYLEGVYWRAKGQDQKAVDQWLTFLRKHKDMDIDRSINPGSNHIDYQNIARDTLELLKNTEEWKKIIEVLKLFYRDNYPESMFSNHQRLLKKAKNNLEGDTNEI